ncbi:MAG: hypothetical protein GXO74_00390 [Calditrichaeota bacterium]|nr:hypothetical protein [Calditrichota bacterium]
MVDINLIGDDQTQFEPDENEKNFQDAYSADSGDFSQNSFMRNDSFENSDYTKVIHKSGSRVGVIVLFIIVLGLLAITAYILFKPAKTQRIASVDNADMESAVEAIPAGDSTLTPVEDGANTSATPAGGQAASMSTTAIPATILDRITRSYSGFNTINQLVNSIPPAANFTMITYSDGRVIFELLSEDATTLSDIDAVLRQRMPSANLEKVSGSSKIIKGKKYFQALIKGEIDSRQFAGQPPVSSTPRFLDAAEMQQLLKRVCEQNGARLLELSQGTEKIEKGLAVSPLTVRISGLKSNLLQTMKNILDENVNISFVKISLIAKEMELGNPEMTLVLHVSMYRNA